jgi:hypothetical protein
MRNLSRKDAKTQRLRPGALVTESAQPYSESNGYKRSLITDKGTIFHEPHSTLEPPTKSDQQEQPVF